MLQNRAVLPVCTRLAEAEPAAACQRPGAMALFTLLPGATGEENGFSLAEGGAAQLSDLAALALLRRQLRTARTRLC